MGGCSLPTSASDFLGPLDGSLPCLSGVGVPSSFHSICVNAEGGLGPWGTGFLRKVGCGGLSRAP